jgi:hypothetical protein
VEKKLTFAERRQIVREMTTPRVSNSPFRRIPWRLARRFKGFVGNLACTA